MSIGCNYLTAQSYDQDRKALSNFIERMYKSSPFEGCRFIDDYDKSYFVSIVVLDKKKYKSEIAMNRVAQVKSQRNAGEFLNGTQSYTEYTIQTPKCKGKEIGNDETYEVIKANSTGYVQHMQLLNTFEDSNNLKVFVFVRETVQSNQKK